MKKVLHRSFKPAKCKTSLQMSSSRLKILKNKKDIQIKQLRRELAQLLESGQIQTASIRVEHVVREEKTVAAYELVGIYCELLVARLSMIESQKNCPTDLKEAVASVLYASQRLSDVTELSDVVKHFSAKYGKDFASAAIELRPNSGVSRLLAEKLSVKAPDGPTKVKILTAIAEEHNVEWEAKSLMEPDPKEAEQSGPSSFQSQADSYRAPDKEPPNIQAPSVQHGSSERDHVPVNSYYRYGRSPSHPDTMAPPDVNSSENYHQNVRPSGFTTDSRREYQHPNRGDGNSSRMNRHDWDMEFVDSTAAAHAAAESAERASMAARAAAELSNRERTMRQTPSDPHRSSSSHHHSNEHPHRHGSTYVQSEDHPSPTRNFRTQHEEETGSIKQDKFSGPPEVSEYSDEEPSEKYQTRKGRYAKSEREEHQSVVFSDEAHSRQDSSRSHSRTFSDDHVPESHYTKSPNVMEEHIDEYSDNEPSDIVRGRYSRENSETGQNYNVNEPDREKKQSDSDLNVVYSDSGRASPRSHSRNFSDEHVVPDVLEENIFATRDEHQTRNSAKSAFDDYDSFFDKPQFDNEDTYKDEPEYRSGFSLLSGAYDTFPGKQISSSDMFMEKPKTAPVFDEVFEEVTTGPVSPLHEPVRSAKFDDYDQDSENEEDKTKNKAKPVEGKRLESKSRQSSSLRDPDNVKDDFFPSDTDEHVYDSRTREESDSEKEMSLRFGALTGGFKNRKALPPYRMGPARDVISSKIEKEYTPREIYTEKNIISSSSSEEDSDPRRTSTVHQGRKPEGGARSAYLHSRIIKDDDSDSEEEVTKRRGSGHNAVNLPSPSCRDEASQRTNNTKLNIGLSRRTKGQVKGERESRAEEKRKPLVIDEEMRSENMESGSNVETSGTKERATHVHPKLPDYEDLLARLGPLRSNRQ